jgi:hypothetical protein
MVTPIDLSSLEAEAAEWKTKHNEIDGKPPVTKAGAGWKFGIVETPQGVYALCDEGVGPVAPVTAENTLTVEFYDKSDPNMLAMFPFGTAELDDQDLLALPQGEPVNLEEFIRTFGSRLDGNYASWKQTLERAQAVTA